jgi:hypothetical protein
LPFIVYINLQLAWIRSLLQIINMRFFVSAPFLFLAVFNTANAVPSTHNGGIRSLMSRVELMAKRNSTTTDDTPSTKNESPSCARATLLAKGIQMNIDDQNQEKNSLENVNDILTKDPVDQKAFADAKTALLMFVMLGIKMREMNQLIAPHDNPAVPGLQIVSSGATTRVDDANNHPIGRKSPTHGA